MAFLDVPRIACQETGSTIRTRLWQHAARISSKMPDCCTDCTPNPKPQTTSRWHSVLEASLLLASSGDSCLLLSLLLYYYHTPTRKFDYFYCGIRSASSIIVQFTGREEAGSRIVLKDDVSGQQHKILTRAACLT